MRTENIVVGKLERIDDVQVHDLENQYKIQKELEENNPNLHYLVFSHSYSLSEVSDKSYFFKIPFGKYKGKFIDLKNVDTILSLIKIYFSLFGLDEFAIYCKSEDKEKEYEDGMCKVGDIVLDVEGNVRYYKSGFGFPDEKISFCKIKKLIKNGEIQEHITGK